MKCDQCGAEGDGNYCARCGAPLEAEPEGCPACGAPAADDAYFCTECGEPLGERPAKSPRDYLPWALSGLALVAFAVAIAFFVQEQAAPRGADDPPTGGIIEGGSAGGPGGGMGGQGAGSAGQGGGSAPAEGMPSASELAQMPPREAADRLYNRAMRMQETGAERAPFFAQMGVRAYRRVPPEQVDADLRFHVGLLQLVQGDAAAARAEADTILSETPGHLLGLLLAARASGAAGETEAEARWRDSLRTALENTDLSSRPEYRAHADLLETASVSPRDGG